MEREITKGITYSITGPVRAVLARNIPREEEIEIPAASSRSFIIINIYRLYSA